MQLMNVVRHIASFLILLIISACQFEDGTSTTAGQSIDSIEYVIKSRSKEIGNCESFRSQCAKILIQTLDIKSGISDKSAVNIELDIEKEILLSEGEETSMARNINELIELLVEEYENLISELKDYNLPWEISYNIEVINNTRGILTIAINSYSYRGGAHGIASKRYLNYNLINGHRITLDSAFVKDEKMLLAAEKFFRQSQGLSENEALNDTKFNFPNNRFFLPDNFLIRPNEIIFLYNAYEIAPYSDGMIEFKMDVESMKTFIKSEALKGYLFKAENI